jgi:cobalamin biosynthetic protein CobC
MAKSAIATDIATFADEAGAVAHGGDLAAARRLFPAAPQPFVDLSTGINPYHYPLPRVAAQAFARLPAAEEADALAAAAARAYGAPSPAHVVAAPGTQILLPHVAGLVDRGGAAIVGPTYGEFARAATLAGHRVQHVGDLAEVRDAQLVFLANPNNPDGRLSATQDLLDLASRLRGRGGMLVVDEAFMDADPIERSLAAELSRGNILVLRSFGKFFGLAGIRLGFALAAPKLAARLSARLGPWAVSGPALAVGTTALSDTAWIETTRGRLARAAQKLDRILIDGELEIVGGTPLFRLVQTPTADALFHHLGRAGILVRRFSYNPAWLRFGLPTNAQAWRRLQIAMTRFAQRD